MVHKKNNLVVPRRDGGGVESGETVGVEESNMLVHLIDTSS